MVHRTSAGSGRGAPLLERVDQYVPQVELLWADQGYTGSGKGWVKEQLGCHVSIVQHPQQPRGHWVLHGDLADLSTVWLTYERF